MYKGCFEYFDIFPRDTAIESLFDYPEMTIL